MYYAQYFRATDNNEHVYIDIIIVIHVFPLLSTESYVVTIRWNRLDETIQTNVIT